MGQASTCAKLHGTNSENHDDFSRSPSYVRRIGQRTSEASDITVRRVSVRSFIHGGTQVGEPQRQTGNDPIEFVVYRLATPSLIGFPRVKTCNRPPLLLCSALNMH